MMYFINKKTKATIFFYKILSYLYLTHQTKYIYIPVSDFHFHSNSKKNRKKKQNANNFFRIESS